MTTTLSESRSPSRDDEPASCSPTRLVHRRSDRATPRSTKRNTGVALSQNSCTTFFPRSRQADALVASVRLRHAVRVSRRAARRGVLPRKRTPTTTALFAGELFGIDSALERVIDYFKAAAAGSDVGRRLLLLLGPPSGGKSSLVILLKRGLEEYSHTEDGALYALQGSPLHESPLNLIPASLRPRVPLDVRRRHSRRAVAVRARAARRRVPGRLHALPRRAHLSVRGRARRRRHVCAARSDDGRHRGPRGLRRSVEGRRHRRRRRPAGLVLVGRRLRREPRRARDDRDPEGQARVPVSAADADARKERQGVALPADPPRRDDPRAHEPGRVQQVLAGEGERGAARSHGDRQGAVHAVVPRRGAHLSQARVERAGVPQGALRPARRRSRGRVRDPDAPAEAATRRPRSHEEAEALRQRGRRGLHRGRRAAHPCRVDGRRLDGREPALRHQRDQQRDHAQQRRRA